MRTDEITNLERNIREYMKIKGIKFYSELLKRIGIELGLNYIESIEFVKKQKSNFSKMLKGERPLERKYIEPLEQILGVSLVKLTGEFSSLKDLNKDEIPFIKGFRYYAYKDDLNLYDELDKSCTIDSDSVLTNSDEFNKFFLDYLVEYQAINGVEFLYKKHKLYIDESCLAKVEVESYRRFLHSNYRIEVAKFIARKGNGKLFENVFHNFSFVIFNRWDCENLWCNQDEFLCEVIKNEDIFKSLFDTNEYSFESINRGCKPLSDIKPNLHMINPLLSFCLDCALKKLDQFKNEAVEILNFAYKYNNIVISKLDSNYDGYFVDSKYYISERGGMVCGNLILPTITETGDKEIDDLIKNLPCLKSN